jgi:outer membrane protein assembly factor BamE
MPVSFAFRLTVLAAACAALSACSSLNNVTGRIAGLVTPYKVEVVQGNFVSKEQKDALQVGMPRAQVRDILGSPLVTSVFHADRWEYVFTIRRQGQEPQQRKLTVFFRGDELVKVESDEMISEQEFVASLSAGRGLGKAPVLELPADKIPSLSPAAAPQNSSSGSGIANQPARVYPPLEPVVR